MSSTAYDVQIRRETITNTIPTTTTRTVPSTSTTIVATTAGFAPIGGSINRGPMARRELQHPHALFERQNKNVGVNQAKFPKDVRCKLHHVAIHQLTKLADSALKARHSCPIDRHTPRLPPSVLRQTPCNSSAPRLLPPASWQSPRLSFQRLSPRLRLRSRP